MGSDQARAGGAPVNGFSALMRREMRESQVRTQQAGSHLPIRKGLHQELDWLAL